MRDTTVMIQNYFEKAGRYSCLALCYLYSFIDRYIDGDETDKLLSALLLDAYKRKAGIDEDFFVYDPVCLITTTGFNLKLKVDVKKKQIESIQDLNVNTYNCVEFKYNDKSHFVLYKGRNFLFNSLDSVCFKYGKPVSVREVRYED